MGRSNRPPDPAGMLTPTGTQKAPRPSPSGEKDEVLGSWMRRSGPLRRHDAPTRLVRAIAAATLQIELAEVEIVVDARLAAPVIAPAT